MSIFAMPASRPRSADLARKKFVLGLAVWMFLGAALLIMILPIGLPKPLRLAIAGTDLLAAAIIGLLGRQRYGS